MWICHFFKSLYKSTNNIQSCQIYPYWIDALKNKGKVENEDLRDGRSTVYKTKIFVSIRIFLLNRRKIRVHTKLFAEIFV